MLPERRQELIRRRQQIQERHEREFRDEIRRNFIAPLDQTGLVYALVKDEPLVAWITDRFTVDEWSSIDWTKVAERQCTGAEGQDASVWLATIAAEKALGDPVVAVVFADATAPSLTMRHGELVRHADIVIDFNWQTWVFDPSDKWIVEFHHDLGWCWGKSA